MTACSQNVRQISPAKAGVQYVGVTGTGPQWHILCSDPSSLLTFEIFLSPPVPF